VAKLADAPDLGSGGAILRGSSPLSGINKGSAGDSVPLKIPKKSAGAGNSAAKTYAFSRGNPIMQMVRYGAEPGKRIVRSSKSNRR
jgi:hypothetical protein